MNWKRLSWKIVLLLLFGTVIFFWLIKAPMMSWYLTRKIGVPVSMDSISIWPSQSTIRDFKLKNPPGFKRRDALQAKKTTIDYRFSQLFGNPSEIDQIEIDDIYLSIILTSPMGATNNWTAIAAGMPSESKDPKENVHEVIIHRLILSNLNVEIQGGKLVKAPPSKHIDRLEFNEVSSKTGFPTKELIQAIFQGAGIQQYIKDAFDPSKVLQKWVPTLFGDRIDFLQISSTCSCASSLIEE
jgi:hypothetical protein